MTVHGGLSEARYREVAGKAGRSADHTSPLRRIVDYGTGLDPEFEMLPRLLLECGHVVRYPRGAWSSRYSTGTRRRCEKCAKGLPPDRDVPPGASARD